MRASLAAVTVMASPGRKTSSRPGDEAVASDVDLAVDHVERALLGRRHRTAASRRRRASRRRTACRAGSAPASARRGSCPRPRARVLPSPLTIGSSCRADDARSSASISSSPAGSATQHCSPCSGSPPARRSGAVRSECTMPRPAVIQLTSPGRIGTAVPRLSRCMISPSNRKVTVASPICGCGRTSMPWPLAELGRPEMVEEDERPDHAPLGCAAGRGAPRSRRDRRCAERSSGRWRRRTARRRAAGPCRGRSSWQILGVRCGTLCRARAAGKRGGWMYRHAAASYRLAFPWQAFVTRMGPSFIEQQS